MDSEHAKMTEIEDLAPRVSPMEGAETEEVQRTANTNDRRGVDEREVAPTSELRENIEHRENANIADDQEHMGEAIDDANRHSSQECDLPECDRRGFWRIAADGS
ncbi:hypothetical protein NM688_g9310 [Phlebia brevispora]|uniref:Uncharacterized protein n=1 Tax=Phlebia brevispora TaxID=194682 RepID=A0ACC1RIC3_9APHY|nr:hypothetical protein NM688_g9310 [Phlebia brevispora]